MLDQINQWVSRFIESPHLALDMNTLAVVSAMMAATYFTRISGLLLLRYYQPTGRIRAGLEAVPPAVLMAVIAPQVLATGFAETGAALIAAIAATRLPLFFVVAIGVVAIVSLRAVFGG